MKSELLTVEGVKETEQAIITSGLSEKLLMQQAGEGVVEVILEKFSPCPTVIFCGPGKNGGDGKIVARLLQEKGWPVDIVTLKKLPPFKEIESLINQAELIVDALFGTGFSQPLEENILLLMNMINASRKPVVSIDIPTGVETNSGTFQGECIEATYTVTFFRPRLGHYLLPGREYRGELIVKELGLPDAFLPSFTAQLNGPTLWNHYLQDPKPSDHNMTEAHALSLQPVACQAR